MNKELGKKWVSALRSGDYGQCREALHLKDDGYCCLGVLCDIYKNETGEGTWHNTNSRGHLSYNPTSFRSQFRVKPNIPSSNARPSRKVLNWIGIRGVETLIRMNDYGKSFNEIADYIEEKYNLTE